MNRERVLRFWFICFICFTCLQSFFSFFSFTSRSELMYVFESAQEKLGERFDVNIGVEWRVFSMINLQIFFGSLRDTQIFFWRNWRILNKRRSVLQTSLFPPFQNLSAINHERPRKERVFWDREFFNFFFLLSFFQKKFSSLILYFYTRKCIDKLSKSTLYRVSLKIYKTTLRKCLIFFSFYSILFFL